MCRIETGFNKQKLESAVTNIFTSKGENHTQAAGKSESRPPVAMIARIKISGPDPYAVEGGGV